MNIRKKEKVDNTFLFLFNNDSNIEFYDIINLGEEPKKVSAVRLSTLYKSCAGDVNVYSLV